MGTRLWYLANVAVNTLSAESTFPQRRDDIRDRFVDQTIRPGSLLESVSENVGSVRKQEGFDFLSNKAEKTHFKWGT